MKSSPHNSPWKNDDCSYVSDEAEDPNSNHYDRDAPGELHVGVVPGEQLVADHVRILGLGISIWFLEFVHWKWDCNQWKRQVSSAIYTFKIYLIADKKFYAMFQIGMIH